MHLYKLKGGIYKISIFKELKKETMFKTTLITILSLFSFIINAQIINFPDSNFKLALITTNCVDSDGDGIGDIDADTNEDNEIDMQEAQSIFSLIVRAREINSLDGIENFTNLEKINCSQNLITSLDFSENLALTELNCFFNEISEINVSENNNLQIINCDFNKLTQIDVTNNVNLERLWCTFNNLSSINVSQNENLISLNVSSNILSEIEIANNTLLEKLYFNNNNISQFDISQNPNLSFLDCSFNALESIDVSSNAALQIFNCQDNDLTYLNFQTGTNNAVTSFNSENNPTLKCIQVDDASAAYLKTLWRKDETTIFSKNCLLSLYDSFDSQFSIFPNPTKNEVNINGVDAIYNVELFTISGKKLLEVSNGLKTFSTSTIPAGMYIVLIEGDYGFSSHKLIKE